MGATIMAFGVIGVLASKDDLPLLTRESCEHPERVGQRFCPECGKEAKTIRETDDLRWEEFQTMRHPRGYISAELLGDSYRCSHVLVGWGKRQSWRDDCNGIAGYSGKLIMPSMDEIKATIDQLMEPWPELYRPETFGFHLHQYYS